MKRALTAVRFVAVALAAVAALAACGGDDSGAASLELELQEQNGSGQAGTATLTEAENGKTRITVELSNPPEVPQPSHVHPGSCGDLGPPVAGLANVVDGRAETVVDMSLDELRTGELVVHAHKSAQEYETSVACARIPAE